MEIYYRSQKMKKLCDRADVMKKELGNEMADKLQQRLVLLKNTPTLAGIPTDPHHVATNCTRTVMDSLRLTSSIHTGSSSCQQTNLYL